MSCVTPTAGFALTDYLWLSVITLLCVTACVMLRQKTYCSYPLFAIYVVTRVARELLLRSLVALRPCDHSAYFYAYWISSAVENVVLVAVLFEFACALFAPHDLPVVCAWRVSRWLTPEAVNRAFRYCLAVLIFVCAIFPIGFYSNLGYVGEGWYLVAFTRTGSLIVTVGELGAMLLGLVLSAYLGIPWRRRAAAFAAGLIAQAIGWLAYGWLVLDFSGTPHDAALYAARMCWVAVAADIAGVGLWLAGMFLPEKQAIRIESRQIAALRRLGQEMLRSAEQIRERG